MTAMWIVVYFGLGLISMRWWVVKVFREVLPGEKFGEKFDTVSALFVWCLMFCLLAWTIWPIGLLFAFSGYGEERK